MDGRHAEYVRLCQESHGACLQAATHLSTSGRAVDASQIRLLFHCAELCHTSAGLLREGTGLAGPAAGAAAELCDRCARLCDDFGDDPTLRACAEACRRCVEAWRRVTVLAA